MDTSKIEVPELLDIKMKLNSTLDNCLKMFDIHKNVEKVIRNKMLSIMKKNKEIGKLKNLDAIIFVLLVHSIKELKIPINRRKINEKIKNYIATNVMLKDLKNLSI